MVKLYPKALPRKNTAKERKKGCSRILSETPENNAIVQTYLERMKRLEKSSIHPIRKEYKPNTKALNLRNTICL